MDTRQFMQAAIALKNQNFDGLKLFRPTEAQVEAIRRMTLEHCFEVMIDGGNRSGKTTLAAVFFASFVRDEPITTWDGEEFHCRPEHKRGRPVNTWIVGDHLRHLGMTIYRMLFDAEASKSAFMIIPDELTGAWRAWNPKEFENDWERKALCKPAPPLIPAKFIEDMVFAPGHKTDHEFRYIKLTNGTTIHGFASSGEVKQGDAVDLLWIDENIVIKRYYAEWQSRLWNEEGMLVWSTIPRDDCHVYSVVKQNIEDDQEEYESGQRELTECYRAHISLSFLDSPFIPDRAKEVALAQMGDREAMVRIYGKTSTRLISVYQDYNAGIHVVDTGDPSKEDEVLRCLRDNNMVPPKDWTRELILDPGTQKPAILLGTIPPKSMWDHDEPYFIPYREIFIRRASPKELAEKVMETEKDYVFERFIIDGQMGRQRPPGFVESVDYQYSKAFRAAGLHSRQTEYGFIYGDADFTRRSKQVIRTLQIRPCGRPQLRIINQLCPKLVEQMNTNVRKTTPDGEPTESCADHQVDDLRDCLEYWISRRPTYMEPPESKVARMDPGVLAYERHIQDYMDRKSRSPKTKTIEVGVP